MAVGHGRHCSHMRGGVQAEIEAGNVALDHMDPNFKEGMVLVKDKYSSERRKAKILNFSLAYGKTEYGLSKDFNVTLAEAKGIVERWYKSRPEVSHHSRRRCVATARSAVQNPLECLWRRCEAVQRMFWLCKPLRRRRRWRGIVLLCTVVFDTAGVRV